MRILKFIFFNGLSRTILRFDFGGTDNKAPDRVKAFLVEGLYNFNLNNYLWDNLEK